MQHLKSDLGTVQKGSTVVVTLDKQANVLLMDPSNYRIYSSGRGGRYQYRGGLAKQSPVRIPVPSTGHWILAIDLAGGSGQIRHSISVQSPPRGNLPEYRNPTGQPIAGNVAMRTPAPPESPDDLDGRTWDVFLSHASEDKASVAIPLAQALQDRGVTVWLDKAELRIGDSLRRRIDRGLKSSRFAAVILSEHYFAKGWPQYEFDGIVTLSVDGRQSLLPIWHEVTRDQVASHSPSLADKLARNTSDTPLEDIAEEIAEMVLQVR
ncbi:hypothetical protein J2T10_004151 [Paenarthrobacter nicotinovorans]|uniref:TIR domain-containing protein n=1 Tax=Paenarthrobacter nicotinovorans TaxID=29320 RepID=A0ABT9TS18_PAENI|nr:DUF1883 domain-containing protein [Paenarthrobacter nicotinovorans]MDQ0104476.1 hypothetical protein [Paenarthrobacter nicotinovorans]